uniref:Uncharacterized protein n=1 Tax=Rhizophora mucronata TaxID=61149 RepID=A0A2P2MKM2_RHIMU
MRSFLFKFICLGVRSSQTSTGYITNHLHFKVGIKYSTGM